MRNHTQPWAAYAAWVRNMVLGHTRPILMFHHTHGANHLSLALPSRTASYCIDHLYLRPFFWPLICRSNRLKGFRTMRGHPPYLSNVVVRLRFKPPEGIPTDRATTSLYLLPRSTTILVSFICLRSSRRRSNHVNPSAAENTRAWPRWRGPNP